MNGKISNCYNVGEITGSGYVSKIAVSAYNDSRPTNCYYLSDTDTDLNGTAKTAAEFANGDVLEELKAGRNDSPWDSCQYVAAAKITLPVFKDRAMNIPTMELDIERRRHPQPQLCLRRCGDESLHHHPGHLHRKSKMHSLRCGIWRCSGT